MASAIARLEDLARREGYDLEWRERGLCPMSGQPIVVLNVRQRRKHIAQAFCTRLKNVSLAHAREQCAETFVGRTYPDGWTFA